MSTTTAWNDYLNACRMADEQYLSACATARTLPREERIAAREAACKAEAVAYAAARDALHEELRKAAQQETAED